MRSRLSGNSRLRLLMSSLLLLLFAHGSPAQTPAATAAHPSTTGLTLKWPLPNKGDIKKLELPPDQVTITILGVLIKDPENAAADIYHVDVAKVRLDIESVSISSLAELLEELEKNNLAPTPDVIGLILDLNPGISRLNSLAPKTKLLLPDVVGGDDVKRAAGRQLFTLHRDSAAAQRAILSREQVKTRKLSDQIAETEPSRFGGPREKTRLKGALDSAENSLKVIGGEQAAIGRRVREQTMLEANALQVIANEALSPKGGIAPDMLRTAESISSAMAKRSADVNGGGSGTAPVTVRAVRLSDHHKEIDGKRVVCKAAYGNIMIVYTNPSSPTTEALPLGGEYVCWASEGEPYTPISEKVPVTVQEQNAFPVKIPPPGDDQ